MYGKAHGLKIYETNVGKVGKWLQDNSGREVIDIKYSIGGENAYVIIIYRD